MFERYTEKARRVIFFARYEASQFGSPFIETEHLLLGLLREDKPLANRFLQSAAAVESIRQQIEQHTTVGLKVSTSVDLPLSHECKRVLAYAAEESERMSHRHIHTPHLWLGLLREEKSFAAELLRERGLRLATVREEVMRSELESSETSAPRRQPPEILYKLLRAWEELGGLTVTTSPTVGNHTPDFAIYAGEAVKTGGEVPETEQIEPPSTPAEEIAQLDRRIKLLGRRMENVIAKHEFERAKSYSDEEREQRERLRQLCEQYDIPEPAGGELEDPTPFLCIEIVRHESLSKMRARFDDYFAAGVAQVWALDFLDERAYTVTANEGLSEFKGEILRMGPSAVKLDLKKLFS